MRVSGWVGFILLVSSVSLRLVAQTHPATAAAKPVTSSKTVIPDYSKEPYVFELIEEKHRFETDGKGQRELSARVRVQSESAVRELGLLVYPYNSAFESLEVLYARVLKPDGSVVETPPSGVKELDSAVSRQAPMYTDQREKHIAIKSLSAGDTLEFKLRWTVHDPIAPGYFWFDTSLFKEGICLKQILEISVPLGTPVKITATELDPQTWDEAGRTFYSFQKATLQKPEPSKIPAWERDFHGTAPPEIRISSFPSWEIVGAWYNSLQQPKLAVTPEVRARAEELTKGKTTDDEKIRAIYDFVSTHFRYIGVDLGMGRYSPHSASDVLANRYGDCKDKHTLFASLLQAVGITAYPAVISSKFRIDPSLPSISLFDHVITAIPRGDNFLFLDTTPEVAPYGLLLANLRDRQALVIPANAPARLVATPAEPLVPNFEVVHINGSIDTNGKLDAKFSIEEHGDAEVLLRSAFRGTPQNNWQELTQNIVRGMGFGGTVSDVSVTQPEDTSKTFFMTFTYHRTDYPEWKNRRITLPAPYFYLNELTEEQKISKDPLPVGSQQDITFEATIALPKGFTAVLPDPVNRKPNFGTFTATYSTEHSNVIHGTLHLHLAGREVPGVERAAFDEFSKTVRETPNRYIFIKGDFHADASQPSDAPQAFVRNPNSPEQLISRLENFVASNPDNEQARSALVLAYLNNKQPERAQALLDKVEAANPDSTYSVNYLYGKTYIALKDKEKAFARFQKAVEQSPEPIILNDIAWDLDEAGIHPKEALDYSKQAVNGLAAKTVVISPDDAEASDFQLMPQLSAAWDTLGWIYFRQNQISDAQKYLESAWQLSQAPVIGEHLVEVYEKLGESRKAAPVCVMALAGGAQGETYEKLTSQWGHLKTYIKLPGGQTSIQAASSEGSMLLSDIRTFKIPFHTKLQGNSRSAQIILSLVNGPKVDDVTFSSGAEELRNAVADIAAAKYSQSFPDGTSVRVLRKGTLSCSIYTKGCSLILFSIRDAAVPF
jgi:tetratricopeptide (TPR) repeat protein